MNSTEQRVRELRERIARNRHLYIVGAVASERQDIKRKMAGPLIAVSFIAGMVAGSGSGFKVALRGPLIRNALQVMGAVLEDL